MLPVKGTTKPKLSQNNSEMETAQIERKSVINFSFRNNNSVWKIILILFILCTYLADWFKSKAYRL